MNDDIGADTPIATSSDGITVRKSFEGEAFAVPAIKFELESDRNEPVAIRLIDHIPEDFPMDCVGFHPEYENDNWTAYKDHRVQYNRTIEPDEQVLTVYGIRLTDPEDVPGFMTEPELYEVGTFEEETAPGVGPVEEDEPGGPDAVEEHTIVDIVSEDSTQLVRDIITDESETLPGLEDKAIPQAAEADGGDPLGDSFDESSADVEPIPAGNDEEVITESVDEGGDAGGLNLPPTEEESSSGLDLPSDESEPEGLSLPEDDAESGGLDLPSDTELSAGGDESSGDGLSLPDEPDETADADGLNLPTDDDEQGDTLESRTETDAEGGLDLPEEDAAESFDSPDEPSTEDEPAEDLGIPEAEDDEPVTNPDELIESVEESDDTGGQEETAELSDSPDDTTDSDVSPEPAFAGDGSVAATLANEIRQGAVDDADLQILRERLDFDPPESTNVRLRHLQSRVEDLAAYAEALEEFIDEHGTAAKILEPIEEDADELEARLAEMEAEIEEDEVQDQLSDIRSELETTPEPDEIEELEQQVEELQAIEDEVAAIRDLEDEVDALQDVEDKVDALQKIEAEVDAIGSVGEEVSQLEVEFEELEELVGANTEDVTSISGDVEEVRAELDAVADIETEIASVSEDVSDLSEELSHVEDGLTKELESVRGDVEEIHEELADIQEWRGQLNNVFGNVE